MCFSLADIGDLVVLMAKRRYLQHTDDNANGNDDSNETTTTRRVVSVNQKMICHVFESDEVSLKEKNFYIIFFFYI